MSHLFAPYWLSIIIPAFLLPPLKFQCNTSWRKTAISDRDGLESPVVTQEQENPSEVAGHGGQLTLSAWTLRYTGVTRNKGKIRSP
jgi:hypothetical protein